MTVVDTPLPAFLDRRPLVYSYTLFNTYRSVCPHQMFRRYIQKDIPYVETPEMAWGTAIHKAFEHRLMAGQPLPDKMRAWEPFATPFDVEKAKGSRIICEKQLGCTSQAKRIGYFDSGVWFRGKADAVIIKETTAFINDWKSGSSKFENPFELATNAVLLKINFPELTKVMGSYTWLKENRMGQMYDLSDFRTTWDTMVEIAGLIEADRASGEFEKRKSGLCGYCNVADCENVYKARP